MKRKNTFVAILCAVICIMVVAYAGFATTLTISGNASIDSEWSVIIPEEDGIICTPEVASGGSTEGLKATGQVTSGTSATFSMSFVQPGDSATCVVKISNKGSLNARVDDVQIEGNDIDGAIHFSVTGIDVGDTLASKASTAFNVKAVYDANVSSDPVVDNKTKNFKITIIYKQELNA